ncbi:ATP-binding protein [Dermacoccaceae bacterium W4C1]
MGVGQLRIYLGAAPGVGKTVAMLEEARRRIERGTDVVVGVVETHGRKHTESCLVGLEQAPRRSVLHRGSTFYELDVDAVLLRRPDVVLVDELAHSNVGSGLHPKRWQDVRQILDAGIDVISTVNIQHLESLNDAVASITGITQQETVPDSVVRGADQIQLVDMDPEALRRRLAHGNVYASERVDAALANYFRPGNLSALRELALLWLADRVTEGLGRYRDSHDIDATWPTRERVVVALSGGQEGETILRRGARIAARGAGGELLAVHVGRGDGLAGRPLPELAGQRQLTTELGGTFHTVTGDDRAQAILDFARGVNASQVVIGSSRRPRWRSALSPSTSEGVIGSSGDIDVHVVTHHQAADFDGRRSHLRGLPANRVRLGYLAALLGPVLLTAALLALPEDPGLVVTMPLFLLATVLVALLGGIGPALVGALVSSVLLNWFFTPPTGGLTIGQPANAVALAVFLLVASTVAWVVHHSARRADAAIRAQAESGALASLSRTMLGSTDQMGFLLQRALESFDAATAVLLRRGEAGGAPEVVATSGVDVEDLASLLSSDNPQERVDDLHSLVLVDCDLPAERQRLFAAFASHAGALLQRQRLRASAGEADALAKDNAARTALLSAVSHDLRTPLAGIKAAIGSLRSDAVTFSPQDEAELEEAIEDSADRLESLIDNLLDASRLAVGALVAHPRTVDLGEAIPLAAASCSAPDRVVWKVADPARYAVADPGLLDRVIGNLLENALRHHRGGTPIRIDASALQDRVEIRVVDNGPGIPVAAREDVFRPFQRYGDAPEGDGVGLGLAVARGFTEAMSGSLRLDDTPGGGVTAVLNLLMAQDQA